MMVSSKTSYRIGFRNSFLSFFISVIVIGLLAGCGSTETPRKNKGEKSQRSSIEKAVQSVRDNIQRADQSIQAETVVQDYRVGVTLQSPQPIYRDGETVSTKKDSDRQLRVLLREQSSKRKLAGSDLTARFLGEESNVLQTTELLETWGNYHFYGANVSIPDDARYIEVVGGPPLVGRHEDMKDRYRESVTARFEVSRDEDGSPTVLGEGPSPVKDPSQLGTDVKVAMDESLSINRTGPYRVGFIAEHSEPYWVYRKPKSPQSKPTLVKADVPQSANRHLEVVLFERDSYRIIPHAEVSLDVSAMNKDARATLDLAFLMSAFNHYGNSLYLPAANYGIKTSIGAPTIHTLSTGTFPETLTTGFEWSPDE